MRRVELLWSSPRQQWSLGKEDADEKTWRLEEVVATRWRQTPTLEAGRREDFFFLFLFFLPHLTCKKLIAQGCLLPRPSPTRLLSLVFGTLSPTAGWGQGSGIQCESLEGALSLDSGATEDGALACLPLLHGRRSLYPLSHLGTQRRGSETQRVSVACPSRPRAEQGPWASSFSLVLS